MTNQANQPPPLKAMLRGMAVGIPFFIILSIGLLYGVSYLTWRNSDPADAVAELELPAEVVVVSRFGPIDYLPLEGSAPPNVEVAEGIIMRTSVDLDEIVAHYNAQFVDEGWVTYTGEPGRAELPNRIEVIVQPISATGIETQLGETFSLDEGERFIIVVAWKSDFID